MKFFSLSFLCISFIFFLVYLSGFYHDDAYIILRYARNLLNGHGPVWNPGEHVEGYSSFFWLMLISALGFYNIDLVLASRILGILYAFLSLFVSLTLTRHNTYFCGLLLATNACFSLWALGGLETTAFSFFVFLACSLFSKNHTGKIQLVLIGFVFCLAAITRPEGILFFIITIVFTLLRNKKTLGESLRNTFLLLSGFLTVYLPYSVWRVLYYGYFFPCTFYVKGDPNILKFFFGTRYLIHFFILYGAPLCILLFVKNIRNFLSDNAYIFSLLTIYCFYIVLIGGDHMPGFRFLVPILPLLYLFLQQTLDHLRFKRDGKMVIVFLIIFASLNFIISYSLIPRTPEAFREVMSHSNKYRSCTPFPDAAAYYGKYVGGYIKQHWSSDSLVAGNTAGSIPYFSDLQFIDMLGLNDYSIARRKIFYNYDFAIKSLNDINQLLSKRGRSEILQKILSQYLPWELMPGHGKGDGRYVLSRKPDYIILGPAQGSQKAWFLGDKEIISSPDFLKQYHMQTVPITVSDCFQNYFQIKDSTFMFTYYERIKK